MSGLWWFLVGLGTGIGGGMAMYLGSGRERARERVARNLRQLLALPGNELRGRDGRTLTLEEVLAFVLGPADERAGPPVA